MKMWPTWLRASKSSAEVFRPIVGRRKPRRPPDHRAEIAHKTRGEGSCVYWSPAEPAFSALTSVTGSSRAARTSSASTTSSRARKPTLRTCWKGRTSSSSAMTSPTRCSWRWTRSITSRVPRRRGTTSTTGPGRPWRPARWQVPPARRGRAPAVPCDHLVQGESSSSTDNIPMIPRLQEGKICRSVRWRGAT